MVCTKTVYNYINKCLLSIKNIDLPIKTVREQNKKIIRENKKKLGKSISERPSHIEDRKEFGHWELDTVIGKKTKEEKVVFTLIERKTRYYIPLIVSAKNTTCINKAFRELLNTYDEKATKYSKVLRVIMVQSLQKWINFPIV